jgi:predicted MFS family arabinose efflux permease
MSQAGNLGNALGTPLMVGAVAFAGYDGLMMTALLLFTGGFLVHLVLGRMRRETAPI